MQEESSASYALMQRQPTAQQFPLAEQHLYSPQPQQTLLVKGSNQQDELDALMAEARALEMQAHLMRLQSQMIQRNLALQEQQKKLDTSM
jgi:hypothetical protein